VTERILVIKLAAIGDVLRTTSILPPLKAQHPGSEITWVTKTNAAPLLNGNPLIDRVLVIEGDYLPYLLNEEFSSCICLDADPQSAVLNSVARSCRRYGFESDRAGKVRPCNEMANEWWHMGLNDGLKRQNRKTYQQIMYEICELPRPVARPQLFITEENRANGREILRAGGMMEPRRIVGINTGGGGRWQHKKWTTEGYIECINLLKTRHPDVDIMLLGGPEEQQINAGIVQAVGSRVIDAGCHNSLMNFSGIISHVDILLTSDSLAMHIGVALGKPTVVLVGPTSPWELDVFGKGAILHSEIECLACYLARCDKDPHCMNSLPPEIVVRKLSELLA
jgi:heptosyltransferase-2